VTHKAIKRFPLEGSIKDDKDIPRLREQYIDMLVKQMRYDGYVQLLDLQPAWTITYDKFSDLYTFKLTVHGVYVGKTKAEKLYGITNSREVPIK
jgi:hypothetical protein